MIVKIIGFNQVHYFEGEQIYVKKLESKDEAEKYCNAYNLINEEDKNYNYRYILLTIFEAREGLKQVITNLPSVYLMNNEGKTIEKLN